MTPAHQLSPSWVALGGEGRTRNAYTVPGWEHKRKQSSLIMNELSLRNQDRNQDAEHNTLTAERQRLLRHTPGAFAPAASSSVCRLPSEKRRERTNAAEFGSPDVIRGEAGFVMDRSRYLREASEALREAEDRRREHARQRTEPACANSPLTRALARFAEALRTAGLRRDGDQWECPSCRSQGRPPELCLEVRVVGQHVEFRCTQECRPNTIHAPLGSPPSITRTRGAPGRWASPHTASRPIAGR